MSRTTVDIDAPILAELKKLQKREGKTLGQTISELLADALARRKQVPKAGYKLNWIAQPMGAPLVDLGDKEAVWAILDAEDVAKVPRR